MRRAGLSDIRQLRTHPAALPVDRMACRTTVGVIYGFAFPRIAFCGFGRTAVAEGSNVRHHLPRPLIVQRHLRRHPTLPASNYTKDSRIPLSLGDPLETGTELSAAIKSVATGAVSRKQLLAHGDIIRRHLG